MKSVDFARYNGLVTTSVVRRPMESIVRAKERDALAVMLGKEPERPIIGVDVASGRDWTVWHRWPGSEIGALVRKRAIGEPLFPDRMADLRKEIEEGYAAGAVFVPPKSSFKARDKLPEPETGTSVRILDHGSIHHGSGAEISDVGQNGIAIRGTFDDGKTWMLARRDTWLRTIFPIDGSLPPRVGMRVKLKIGDKEPWDGTIDRYDSSDHRWRVKIGDRSLSFDLETDWLRAVWPTGLR